MLTKEEFYAIAKEAPRNRIDIYYEPLMNAFEKFGLTTKAQQAMLLVQLLHESGRFQFVVENLNYSAAGLRKTFGKYYRNDAEANAHARQPVKIASRVYANRMGNGDERSQDGWKFRGRGLIQITGRNNYTNLSKDLGVDVVSDPDYLITPEGAAYSAAWFWYVNKINRFADIGDIVGSTKIINGGTNGLDDRTKLWKNALNIIGGIDTPKSSKTTTYKTLKIGSKGAAVKTLQEKLGLVADGSFGKATEEAVKKFQAKVGLTVDGVAGPITQAKLFE